MKFFKKEKGSIVVEAALILPIFILLIILLTSLIKVSMYEVAIDHAVSEATKQIATHMYPVALAKQAFDQTEIGEQFNEYYEQGEKLMERYEEGLADADKLADHVDFINLNGVTLNDLIAELPKNGEELVSDVTSPLFTPVVENYLDANLKNNGELKVTAVKYPSFEERDKAFFGLEVTYTYHLPLPFMDKKIVLKKQAYERVWIGS